MYYYYSLWKKSLIYWLNQKKIKADEAFRKKEEESKAKQEERRLQKVIKENSDFLKLKEHEEFVLFTTTKGFGKMFIKNLNNDLIFISLLKKYFHYIANFKMTSSQVRGDSGQ